MLREQEAATLVPPPGMHTYDLGKRVSDQERARMRLVASRIALDTVLARIKSRLWDFLTETEYELSFGEAAGQTFDQLRSYVDKQLTTIAPPTLEQFQTAYRRLKDGGTEDRAHALTSCRRWRGRGRSADRTRKSVAMARRACSQHRALLMHPADLVLRDAHPRIEVLTARLAPGSPRGVHRERRPNTAARRQQARKI